MIEHWVANRSPMGVPSLPLEILDPLSCGQWTGVPSPLSHCVEWGEGLEAGDIHAESKLAIAHLQGTFPVVLGDDDVVPCDESVAIYRTRTGIGLGSEGHKNKKGIHDRTERRLIHILTESPRDLNQPFARGHLVAL